MLLTISLQESRFIHRRHIKGPAPSFWQAERGSGMVHGVLRQPLTRDLAVMVCDARGVRPVDEAVGLKAFIVDGQLTGQAPSLQQYDVEV